MADRQCFVLRVKGTPSYEDWSAIFEFMKEVVIADPADDFFKVVEGNDTGVHCIAFGSAYTADALRKRMETP